MVLRSRLQPEMDQGPDAERGLVAYRHAIDHVPRSVFNSLSTMISPVWFSVVLLHGPSEPGRINLVIDPNKNLAGAIFEGLDYEAIYILESSIFGHGDFGRLTATLNGTWLSRAELQIVAGYKTVRYRGRSYTGGIQPDRLAAMEPRQFQSVLRWPGQHVARRVWILARWSTTPASTKMTMSGLTGSPKPQMPRSGSSAVARAESAGVDYARSNCVVHVQPATPGSGSSTWLC